ncbi:MAG: GNAT family N-acetyltransferase, partial [Actinomycetota bacterium]
SLELLSEVVGSLPAGLMLTGPSGLSEAVAKVRPTRPEGSHAKYELRDRSAVTPVDERVVALGSGDADRVAALYGTDPGAAFFLPSMLDDDSFVGVAGPDGGLLAAAGTHVLSDRQRIAALGSVFVHPAHRGQRLGEIVTAGVIERIRDRIDVIGLNVAESNEAARRIYDRLGFAVVHTYEEATLLPPR